MNRYIISLAKEYVCYKFPSIINYWHSYDAVDSAYKEHLIS